MTVLAGFRSQAPVLSVPRPRPGTLTRARSTATTGELPNALTKRDELMWDTPTALRDRAGQLTPTCQETCSRLLYDWVMGDLLDPDFLGEDPFEVDAQAAHLFKHPNLGMQTSWTSWTSWTSGKAIRSSTPPSRQRTG